MLRCDCYCHRGPHPLAPSTSLSVTTPPAIPLVSRFLLLLNLLLRPLSLLLLPPAQVTTAAALVMRLVKMAMSAPPEEGQQRCHRHCHRYRRPIPLTAMAHCQLATLLVPGTPIQKRHPLY